MILHKKGGHYYDINNLSGLPEMPLVEKGWVEVGPLFTDLDEDLG